MNKDKEQRQKDGFQDQLRICEFALLGCETVKHRTLGVKTDYDKKIFERITENRKTFLQRGLEGRDDFVCRLFVKEFYPGFESIVSFRQRY